MGAGEGVNRVPYLQAPVVAGGVQLQIMGIPPVTAIVAPET